MKHKTKSPRYCIPCSSIFDYYPYYDGCVEQMKKIIKDNGGKNIRMRNQFDWSNQPKVITFSAGTAFLDDIEKGLSVISEWIRVDNLDNWSKPLGNKLSIS